MNKSKTIAASQGFLLGGVRVRGLSPIPRLGATKDHPPKQNLSRTRALHRLTNKSNRRTT